LCPFGGEAETSGHGDHPPRLAIDQVEQLIACPSQILLSVAHAVHPERFDRRSDWGRP
jgi:hypothetical protein